MLTEGTKVTIKSTIIKAKIKGRIGFVISSIEILATLQQVKRQAPKRRGCEPNNQI